MNLIFEELLPEEELPLEPYFLGFAYSQSDSPDRKAASRVLHKQPTEKSWKKNDAHPMRCSETLQDVNCLHADLNI